MINGLMMDILQQFQAQGKKTFSVADMVAMKAGDRTLAYKMITRLLAKGRIAPLVKGHYVIFSPSEMESRQCSPNDVIDQLMTYKKTSYYVGLLSAAFYYGATHYRPMVFQVVTDKKITKGATHHALEDVEFHRKKILPTQCIKKVNGRYGYIHYASVALTMYDLFKYESYVGGIENLILVVKELLPKLEEEDLKMLLSDKVENTHLQRLGYLLEKLNAKEQAHLIRDKVSLSSVYIKFSRQLDSKGIKNKAWRIIDNVNWEEIDDTDWND